MDERDRYADLLRVAAIGLVVLGHWLAAVILVRDGALEVGRIHAILPWTRWTTWAFQVMPLFFLVGGFANARSWTRARRAGTTAPTWIRRRAIRLLTPLVPLVATWMLLVPVLLAAGLPREQVQLASQVAFLPTWFLAVYLLVITLAPWTWELHERYGWRAILAFAIASAAVDAAVEPGATLVGSLNYVLVWGGLHQAGYFWHERRLPARPSSGLLLAAGGLGAALALVAWAGYPISMVALEAGARSNANPPTAALFALGLAQLGLVVAAAGPLRRFVEKPRAWATVVALGGVAFTVFVWHMTAMLLAALLAFLLPLGVLTPGVDARWWLLRPAWILLCAGILAPLVLAFRRADRGAPDVATPAWRMALGVLATTAGLGWLVRRGLYDPTAPLALAAGAILALLLGLALLGALRPYPPREARA